MNKLRELVSGKKTYIVALLGILGIWADYFFGLGLSEVCNATPEGQICQPSVSTAIQATWAGIIAITMRAGINK